MPMLNVLVSGPENARTTQAIAQLLSDLTARILHKQPALTAIAVRYLDPAHWIVGGQSLAAQGKSSVHVEVKITDETNTHQEKAAYLAAVYAGLGALLPDLHPTSYIHVQEIRGSSYGYSGLTQAQRAHACTACA